MLKPISFVRCICARRQLRVRVEANRFGQRHPLRPFLQGTDRSAFWYDARLFKNARVQAPKTWRGFQSVAGRLLRAGIKPFAIPAADGQALTDIFEGIYLGQQGQARYERLAGHELQ